MSIDTEIRHVTPAGTNVFLELGFSPTESEELYIQLQHDIDVEKSKKELEVLMTNNPNIYFEDEEDCRHHPSYSRIWQKIYEDNLDYISKCFDNENTRKLIGRGLTYPILYFPDLLIYNINKKRVLNFKKINKKSKFIKIYK